MDQVQGRDHDGDAGRSARQAAQAERAFARAWAGALGGRRHADRAMPPARRPAAPRCAAVPRVIGLPLPHSPVPCALGFLQRPSEGAAREAAPARQRRERFPAAQREGAMR
ncbi:MAG: hypothetical protein RIB84_15830 [Sneathiellaceae bacterium]